MISEKLESSNFKLLLESKSVPIRRKPLSLPTTSEDTYANKLNLSRSTKIRKWSSSSNHDAVPKWINWIEGETSANIDPKITSWWNSIQQSREEEADEEETVFDLQDARTTPRPAERLSLNLQNTQYQFPPLYYNAQDDQDDEEEEEEYIPLSDGSRHCVTPAATFNTPSFINKLKTTPTRSFFKSSFPPPPPTSSAAASSNDFSNSFMNIGYRFNNPNKNPFAHFGENYDSFSSPHGKRKSSGGCATGCPRHTIKTRLQSAKDACNLELRRIIDGLNEYVEKDLLYFETADDVLNHELSPITTNNSAQYSSSRKPSLPTTTPISFAETSREETAEPSYIEGDQDLIKWDAMKDNDNNNPTIMISEDAYLPTPFILTLQDLICLAQSVLDTDLEIFLENSGACADTVSNIQAVGTQWDFHKEWPCKEWYVRLLLNVAALNRVVEWWQAEKSFWAASSANITPTTTTSSTSTTNTVTPLSKPVTVHSTPGSAPGGFQNTVSSLAPLLQQQPLKESDLVAEVSNESTFDDRPRVPRTRDSSVFSIYMQNEDDEEVCQLQEEAEIGQSNTIVMELSLDSPTIQYLSPVWHDVIG